ncbi:PQQ-binding-like beta-propeller repeat protein [Ideonella sp.]|uniref:outer membrane protein assembly factor BamB family protein n=1 Tax=Ideonella sp. TaxID=1929293 RepID=UPI002B487B10|nr:PQQ-binding-like beta-propeller repeat protein [Ideonella sp.]HJV68954.1 PQQ-binding-like beta-propeller repeat protein [Ideonella sp.]
MTSDQDSCRASFALARHARLLGATLLCGAALLGPRPAAWAAGAGSDWPMFGQNARNTAAQAGDTTISPANVAQLAVKWTYTTQGDVSARAAVVGGIVYFPDWGGYLHAVKAADGQAAWSVDLASYGLTGSGDGHYHARTTPAVVKGVLYVGTQEGAWLLAINAATGALVWKTQLESAQNDAFALITSSPTVVGGTVYVGVASLEEGIAGFDPNYPCCKARGSVAAVQANNGRLKWKTYTLPAGYSGAGVWGSNPAVDTGSGLVYVGTGNNYSHPQSDAPSSIPGVSYGQCIADGGSAASCNSADDHVDAVLALDIDTGAIRWSRLLVNWQQPGVTDGSDDWNVACFIPPFTNCPSNPGPDYDFASAPNLITYQTAKGPKTILGAGQKSGIYYALDPKTGTVLWQTQVGPGSSLGGMEWGSATDGKRIYVQVANFYGMPTPIGTYAGLWAALDPATGAILWSTADPNGSIALGSVAVNNGVLYAPSMSGTAATDPTMLALDAATGQLLWSYAAGSSVVAGATIVGGVVYWGSGYAHLGIPGYTPNNRFYAFSLNGQ